MKKKIILIPLLAFLTAFAWATPRDTFDEIEYSTINSAAHPANFQNSQQDSTNVNLESSKKKKKNTFWTKEKLIYGGNFGFRLDPNYFEVLVMPEVGYQFFKPWRITLAPKYEFSGNMPHGNYKGDKSHTAGIQVSTSVDFVRFKKNSAKETSLFIFAAYLYEHQWDNFYETNTEHILIEGWKQYDSDYFDVGIGIRQRVGRRSSFNIMATWHFYDSYYKQTKEGSNGWFQEGYPTISVGFTY